MSGIEPQWTYTSPSFGYVPPPSTGNMFQGTWVWPPLQPSPTPCHTCGRCPTCGTYRQPRPYIPPQTTWKITVGDSTNGYDTASSSATVVSTCPADGDDGDCAHD